MVTQIKKVEVGILFLLTAYFMFVATNVNQTLGLIYAMFALASAIFILADPKRTIYIGKENDSLFGSAAFGVLAYGALVLIGNFVVIPGVQKIIDLLSATTPALSTSAFFNNLSFGVAVPIAETYFFFIVGYDILASVFNVEIERKNLTSLKLWMIMIGIAAAFFLFHLTSKGITNAPILALVFFMGILSLFLVTFFERGSDAVWFHIVSNSTPLLFARGLFTAVAFIPVFVNNKIKERRREKLI